MNKTAVVLIAVFALVLGAAGAASAAGRPDVAPGNAGEHWMNPDNVRHLHNGEVAYRCAVDERGPKVGIDRAQIDEWLSTNRVAAGGQIPVYFHVIYKSGRRGAQEGNVSDADLDAQIDVLNNNYAGKDYSGNNVPGAANTGYTFVKVGTDRTDSRKWFGMTPGSRAERDAKRTLAVSPANTLNIYVCKPGQNLLGWAVFPWTTAAGTDQDGVVIHYGSLPNGYAAPYNLGGTATHEVGHYLGLYHTFQGGCDGGNCSGAGDMVCDTPGEATATSGCPSGKDTCPEPGDDPIHNYMDYSYDACYDNFTPGQDTRMNGIVTAYRPWIGATRVANGARAVSGREAAAGVALQTKPNPFNPRTKISFTLRHEGRVTLRVYDIQGRAVSTLVNGRMPAGDHDVDFNGDRLASGVYLVRLETGDGVQAMKRVTLMK